MTTKIKISSRVLKNCVEKGGDLILEIDLDTKELAGYPQGDEVFLRSHFNDVPENYNSDVCLAANQMLVYVNDEPFSLTRTTARAIKILYEQPGHALNYVDFAKKYYEVDNLKHNESNKICDRAVRHVNDALRKGGVPLQLIRSNSVVYLKKR